MALSDILKDIAPALATALGGPLAGAAVSYLSTKLGIDPAIVEQTVAGMTPTDLVKMKQLDYEFQEFMASNGIKIDLAQIDVNKQEASNASLFVSGWRPFVGWVGGAGLAYASILEPVARFAASVGFGYHGIFPVIDTTITMQVLTGLLGLGALRSYDKTKGTSK